jgi:superfamily II DNA or RNA helicase
MSEEQMSDKSVEKSVVQSNFFVKELYPYQKTSIERIVSRLNQGPQNNNILFQLPTGGGKTIIFSHIAREFIKETKKKVLILTHRIELLHQTSSCLSGIGVDNFVVSSEVKEVEGPDAYYCFIAMVETLNNRLQDDPDFIQNVGLVIVDEAHNNSFRKIFQYFKNVNMLGVTATPLSSNRNLPLNKNYDELIIGASILSLVDQQFLCKPTSYTYDVNLGALRVGINGDYTVSSSERLYGGFDMQEKLITAYRERSLGKKTLIFNPGIRVSWMVFDMFKENGIEHVKHLDSTFSDQERRDTLDWFRNTPNAVLTSVGILTTGFDEPSVETIILNRATRSLTLYHQMIGRGSRVTPTKKNFSIIDLGNNINRFGLWESSLDWEDVFINPDKFLDQNYFDELEKQRELNYTIPDEVIDLFPTRTEDLFLDVEDIYEGCMDRGEKASNSLDICISNHAKLISDNSTEYDEAEILIEKLDDSIRHRLKIYTTCITKSTKSYLNYIYDTYQRRLKIEVKKTLRERDDDE